MDQESFRKLLQTPRPGSDLNKTPVASRGSLLPKPGAAKAKKDEKKDPVFKPRKVQKKTQEKYRNRAEERRIGADHDYSQIEAVLEDFERRNADEDQEKVAEQRRFLGGDSDHSILVKGLDYALLEQNKARLTSITSKQDDESLEAAFLETSSTSHATGDTGAGKKRSRADLIKELKEKRGAGGVVEEEEKKKAAVVDDRPLTQGKFKPIGFKPVGKVGGEEKAKKKKKVRMDEGEEGERKKKKRKVVTEEKTDGVDLGSKVGVVEGPQPVPVESAPVPSTSKAKEPEPEPEPVDEEFDIFADAGEYKGLELEDDEGEDDDGKEEEREKEQQETELAAQAQARRKGWFDDDEPEPEPDAEKQPEAGPSSSKPSKSRSRSPEKERDMEEDEEEGQIMRLRPLESSAIPSIQDILAADEEAEKEEKRKARKEKKKKGKGGGGGEGGDKLERDYQRLKNYEAKKGAAGGS